MFSRSPLLAKVAAATSLALAFGGLSAALAPVASAAEVPPSQTLNYTGGPQEVTVPKGVNRVTVTAVGGSGGNTRDISGGSDGGWFLGGPAAQAGGTLAVRPGATFVVSVGAAGNHVDGGRPGALPGYSIMPGGAGGSGDGVGVPEFANGGASGGGASVVYTPEGPLAVVAGGGGGAGGVGLAAFCNGGAGGGAGATTGQGRDGAGSDGLCGGGGAGGLGGQLSGSNNQGGDAVDVSSGGGGGGGGGGYLSGIGGGGGAAGGGGGGGGGAGSSYTRPSLQSPWISAVSRTGHGYVVLTWGADPDLPTVTLAVSPATGNPGDLTTLTATVPSDATGTITFSANGKVLDTAAVSNGTATLTAGRSLLPGTYGMTARYNGDPIFLAADSNTVNYTVRTPPPNSYVVRWVQQNGGPDYVMSATDGSHIQPPITPTRTGYALAGWFTAATGGMKWNFATDTVTADTVLYAQWTANQYTATFDDQIGNTTQQAVYYGGLVARPADPTREGYDFTGWFTAATGGAKWDFASSTVTGNLTLYAQWTVRQLTVTFDDQNGHTSKQAVAYGDLVAKPADPGRFGYQFAGWFTQPSGGVQWNFAGTRVSNDLTLYAHWTLNQHVVTFYDGFGQVIGTQTVPFNGLATDPGDPSRVGYTFEGWLTPLGAMWNFASDRVTSDIQLHAKWSTNQHTVILDDQIGGITEQTVAYGGLVVRPADPTRAGYTFTGWYTAGTGGTLWDFATSTVTADMALFAHWSTNQHTVVLDDQVGGVTQQTVEYGGLVVRPADPTRAGYTFTGWYTAGTGGTLWDFATSTVTADITLYAQWSANQHTVTLDDQVGRSTQQTVAYGGLVVRPVDPTRTGYAFTGWFTAATGGTLWDFATSTVTADITLYAQWADGPSGGGGGGSTPGTGGASLPRTGSDIPTVATGLLAGVLLLAGVGTVLVRRRREES